MAVALKKTSVKLDLWTDTDILLTVEDSFRGGVSLTIHQYAKSNYKYMKYFNKNK